MKLLINALIKFIMGLLLVGCFCSFLQVALAI